MAICVSVDLWQGVSVPGADQPEHLIRLPSSEVRLPLGGKRLRLWFRRRCVPIKTSWRSECVSFLLLFVKTKKKQQLKFTPEEEFPAINPRARPGKYRIKPSWTWGGQQVILTVAHMLLVVELRRDGYILLILRY